MIHQARIRPLNNKAIAPGDYVLYWMQQSQREECNHALEFAVRLANGKGKPLVVCFGLTGDYPEANIRHYAFMLEGLAETQKALEARGIQLAARLGRPDQIALDLGQRACAIVCDMGYLRHQRAWREKAAARASCRVIQVESDAVVPVEAASPKSEYMARTLRPKIHKLLPQHLRALEKTPVRRPSLDMNLDGLDLRDGAKVLESLNLDQSVFPVTEFFKGGASQALALFDSFAEHSLDAYDKNSNQPQTGSVSHMGPYLHFGQISPLHLMLRLRALSGKNPEAVMAYEEQLVVRRELALNFVYYTADYDAFSCLPAWAGQTLDEHRQDPRPYVYSTQELEKAATHDPYWNAAMKEMILTGYMHNYMRMYWGKKILEWSPGPEEGFRAILALNNKYFLDGRDPNSYEGAAWIYGKHDRAWKERPVFGKVRCMTASGLERKCDIKAYVEKIKSL